MGGRKVSRLAWLLAVSTVSGVVPPCLSEELAAGTEPLVGVAGVPYDLGATRDYDQIFGTLAGRGIDLFFPTFQYEEAPQTRSLGFESDFVPPCRWDDPAFLALRNSGVRLIVPASLLYDPGQPLPPIESDPLAALVACAGDGTLFGVLSYDEPAHNGIAPAATQALYDRIKTVAPDAPVLMVHAPLRVPLDAPSEDPAGLEYLAKVQEHSRAADIVGFDTYPIPESMARVGAPDAGNRILGPETVVGAYLDFIAEAAPGKSYLAVLQNFSPADQYAPEALARIPQELRSRARPPSRAELDAMLHQAVGNGAGLVIWYGGGFTKSEDAPQWRDTLDVSAQLEANPMRTAKAASAASAAMALAAGLAGATPAEQAYRLAEGDEIRIVIPGAPDFAGVYRLGAAGQIALPLEHGVQLHGMTLDEATAAIKQALSSAIQHPVIGVEIAERRPFYIMGDVAESGAYPAQAGLTLGKALAIAGGARRKLGDELQATVVSVRANEEFAGSLFELAAARIRAARIEATLQGQMEFDAPAPPAGLAKDKIAAVQERERAIQQASMEAFDSRMELLQRLLQTRLDEMAALEARLETIAEHARRLDEDIAEVEDLRARGLSTMDRLQSLTREKDRTQSDVLQTSVMLNQAREEQVQIEIQLDEAPSERRIDLLNGLSEAQQRIRQLEGSVAASAQLLDASAMSAVTPDVVHVTFTITRGDQLLESVADLNAPVQAGDLIEVRRTVAAALLGQ